MNRYLLILPLLALLGAAGFSVIRQKVNAGSRGDEGPMDGRVSGFHSAGENGLTEVGDTKHRIRPDHPEQTIEETEELLRTTIIQAVDFTDDQTVSERIKILNELIREEGIKPHQLRILSPAGDPVGQLRFEDELRLRNVPVLDVLRYMTGSSVMMFHVGENGLVQIFHMRNMNEFLPEKNLTEEEEPWTGEVDAFGEPVREFDENDPFAEK